MKKFTQLYSSAKERVVVSIIETTVPALTEELILRAGNKLSKDKGISHVVLVYKTPITESTVVQDFIEKYSDLTQFYSTASEIQNIISKYQVDTTVCQSDISERFKNVLPINSINESMVELAIIGNKEQFKQYIPTGMRDIDSSYLMNLVREQYKIGTISERIELPKNEIRENFYKGSLQIGTVVESKYGLAEVIDRGSNYVTIVTEHGLIKREWPANVTESNSEISWNNSNIDVNEYFYKGYSTQNFKKLSEDSRNIITKVITENKDPFLVFNTLKLIDEFITTNEESISNKVEQNLNKLLEASDADKTKAAHIIANALGCKDCEKLTNATQIINTSLHHAKNKKMTPDSWKALGNMLKLASKLGITYDDSILPKAVQESINAADYKVDKAGRKYPSHKIKLGDEEEIKEAKATVEVDKTRTDNISQGILSAEDFKNLVNKLQPNASSFKQGASMMGSETTDDAHRRRKVNYAVHEGYEDDIDFSDSDIEDMIKHIEDVDDIIDAYDDHELHIVDIESNEIVDDLSESVLNEVLSRVERIRAKMRFARTKAKRERKLELALNRRSSSATINSRARKLAVKTLKMKLAKKPLDNLSTAEKERLERFIEKRKDLVKRIAMKLVPKVRKIETNRLEHKTTKKD